MTANGGRWAWATVSTLGYFASALGGIVLGVGVFERLGLLGFAGSQAHGVGLALGPLIGGIASALIVVVTGRMLLDGPLRAGAGALCILGAGLVLAALTEHALYDWVVAKFGYYAVEFAGWTAALPGAVVAVAVAGFAAWSVQRRADGLAPSIALVLATAGVGFIVLSNVGGLADGIQPSSVPLAMMVGAAGTYCVAVATLAIGRRRRQ